jgi:hypothetical protein
LILIVYYSVARWEEERIADALRRMGVAFEMVDVNMEPIRWGEVSGVDTRWRLRGVLVDLPRWHQAQPLRAKG